MASEFTATKRLRGIDLEHVWHPFTQTSVWSEDEAPIIERGEGMYLVDTDGRSYLDGVSSLWCNVHGHGVPKLVDAIRHQAGELCHSTILGLSHRPILELTERFTEVLPRHLTRVFYSDSGSAAVEAAIRMSIEWRHKSAESSRGRNRLLSLDTAYHGDTLGAVGVGYLEHFHKSLQGSVVPAVRVPPPHMFRFYERMSAETALERSVAALQDTFAAVGEELTACIVEPLVQGAAGMWMHPPAYLQELERLCRLHDVLLICDEVATGFGKTGRLFAHELAGVHPDMLVVGKGLSAGYLPLSAVAVTQRIFDAFTGSPDELKTFFYGQTYAGNPLSAAVASANLDLFQESSLLERLQARLPRFQALLQDMIEPLAHVDEVRQCGVMVGIELTDTPGARSPYPAAELAGVRIVREARRRGVIIRPLGNVVVLMPAPAMEERELELLVAVTRDAIVAALGPGAR